MGVCPRGQARHAFPRMGKVACKIGGLAATILPVMEDPPPPADADGLPPFAAGGARADRATDKGTDWGAALQRHAGWLRRVVLNRVGEPQAVDEVMQEVSLAAVVGRDAGGAVGSSNPAAWLYRVAVRQALLYRRRSGRFRKLLDSFATRSARSPNDGDGANPLRWLISHERDGLVRSAVAQLPRRDADVLVLKYAEQWSYRQIAEHLGLTESAVEARLHRARRRLREELTRLDLNEDVT
jgi:RNA polymerase sigma factor (sigma-70 family)